MDSKELLQERAELFANAISFKRNKRVPLFSNFFSWKYLDAGYKLSEALHNYDILEKTNNEFHQRYQFDAYMDLGTRNTMLITDAMGGGFHKIDETDEALVVDDHHIMERDEYKELAKNPLGFYWTKALKRSCKPDITMGEFENVIKEFVRFSEYAAKMTNKYVNEYGAMLFAKNTYPCPVENLFNILRGIKELSLDIRKCKTEMKECMDILFSVECEPVIKLSMEEDYTGYVSPINIGLLAHSILSVDQFGELYWPYLKKLIDAAIAYKRPVSIYSESTILRFAEYFQDIPKGVLFIHLEQDNIFEVRKKLPNIALLGGMPSELLGLGTKEQCVDYAKKLIDELGDGFILSQNKMMSFRNDAKQENVIAVNEFARSYQY
jgi:hypothetical protein